MVRLKGKLTVFFPGTIVYFNSNMVRLKALHPAFFKDNEEDFNSNMVRLKERRIDELELYYSISIPIWFD